MRRAGFDAIAQLGTPEAVDGLLYFLEHAEREAAVDREAILRAIGIVSTPEAVPELIDALARAEDPALRAALIRGLGASADRRAHDGYPSYVVIVDGVVIYNYQQGSIGQLLGCCDVEVGQ